MSIRSLCAAFESSFAGLGRPLARPLFTRARIRPSQEWHEVQTIEARIRKIMKKFPIEDRESGTYPFHIAFVERQKSDLHYAFTMKGPDLIIKKGGSIVFSAKESAVNMLIRQVGAATELSKEPLGKMWGNALVGAAIEINKKEFFNLSPVAQDFFLASCIARAKLYDPKLNPTRLKWWAWSAPLFGAIITAPIIPSLPFLAAGWCTSMALYRSMILSADERACDALGSTKGAKEYLAKKCENRPLSSWFGVWPETRLRRLNKDE